MASRPREEDEKTDYRPRENIHESRTQQGLEPRTQKELSKLDSGGKKNKPRNHNLIRKWAKDKQSIHR